MSPELTPSQTVGPFFHDALLSEDRLKLVATGHPSAVRIEGTVYDGALSSEEIDAALDPTYYLGSTGTFIARALSLYCEEVRT